MRVTQDFLMAVAEQTADSASLRTLRDVVSITVSNTSTDISDRDLLWFGERLLRLKPDNIDMDLMPGNYDIWWNGGSYVHVYPNELLELLNDKINPFHAPLTRDDLDLIFLRN
jgi:anionic cell wall polymer biosynthesis LytR-Cps2A-Psr (LCP) family protein